MPVLPHPGLRWWEHNEARAAERRSEAERVAAHYAAQERAREESQKAALRAHVGTPHPEAQTGHSVLVSLQILGAWGRPMKRRSRGGERVKARRRKTVTRKRRNAPKAGRRRSLAITHETQLARVIRERDEALKQQTATAEVLKVISRSTFDLKTVLTTLTESAARLCAADFGLIFQQVGGVLRLVANFGFSREAERYWLEHPLPTDRGSSTGRALLEGRAIHIPDVLADPEYRATRYQELAGYRSVLSVPLVRDGTTIGLFGLGRAEVRPFTDKQIELVTTFADQAVIAIENVRLFEAEQQRTRELTESLEQQTATSEVLQVISSSPGDLQPVFETMLEKAVRICDAKFGNIYRWDGSAMHLVAAHNTPPAFAEARRRSALLVVQKLPWVGWWRPMQRCTSSTLQQM